MKTLRKAIGLSVLFVLLFLSACGAQLRLLQPRRQPRQITIWSLLRTRYEARSDRSACGYGSPCVTAPISQDSSGAPNQPASGAPTHTSNNEPYDMFFQDYGVNPSIDTEDDNLSTFALDVDTGSYTVMRNYLNDGNLPPADSVRVEEYVNYFEQGYPIPPAHQAFGIQYGCRAFAFHGDRALRYAARRYSRLPGL